ATMSVSMIDNDEFTKWQRHIPRKLAETTGAPVVLIDHVTKSVEGRGRFAIGAQAKMSTLGGVSYMLEVVQPLGRGVRGELLMWIGKDREGAIRPHQVDYNPKTRMGKIASIIVDSTGPRTYVTVNPPAAADGSGRVPDARAAEHKLAPLMESISERLLESVSAGNTAPLKTSLLGMVIGNKGDKDNALALLEQEGYVKVQADGRAKHVKLVRAYWRAEARKTVERTLLDVPEED
ncbi:MAG TPA: hypothetical protein VII86_01155, partial [Thermoanaerobaculia bacterium]